MREPTVQQMTIHRVLIVEDDPSIASLIADALEGELGVTTILLQDGAEAICFLEHQHIDMIVLDYQLPGANGIQVCDAIQDFPHMHEVPVLFVTANAERADFHSRHLRYIRKPFDLADFLDTVEHCLQQRQANNLSVMHPHT